jgi:serine/threonine-protein kinase
LVSRYETLLPIGTGAMASVHLGRVHLPDGSTHPVALKRAHAHVRSDAKLAKSMMREARLASRLSHPNVVSVLDIEDTPDDLILVLDYVEGCTLRSLLSSLNKHGEERPREVLRILIDTALGLHAAHNARDENGRLLGLVHRDVSPSNILVGVDGIARIADFGIAKALFENDDKSQTGVLKGKSAYMAPEYVMHQRASPASDLWSLAVVGWEALSGTRLFKGNSELETLERIARAAIRPLGSERRDLAMLDHVFARALARSAADRHHDMEEFANDLEDAASGYGLLATHGEVGQLIEHVAHADLAKQRSTLQPPEPMTLVGLPDPVTITGHTLSRPRPRPVLEDDLEPPVDPHPHYVRHVVPQPPESDTAVMDDRFDTEVMPHLERPQLQRPHLERPQRPRLHPARVRAAQPTFRVRVRTKAQISNERLALVAAFALLALALIAMAIRLSSG